jgi:IS5 family transposase
MRRIIKRQRTVVSRLVREIERKASVLTERGVAVRQVLGDALAKAQRIADQSRSSKNTTGASMLYAWHAPEVECIAIWAFPSWTRTVRTQMLTDTVV